MVQESKSSPVNMFQLVSDMALPNPGATVLMFLAQWLSVSGQQTVNLFKGFALI